MTIRFILNLLFGLTTQFVVAEIISLFDGPEGITIVGTYGSTLDQGYPAETLCSAFDATWGPERSQLMLKRCASMDKILNKPASFTLCRQGLQQGLVCIRYHDLGYQHSILLNRGHAGGHCCSDCSDLSSQNHEPLSAGLISGLNQFYVR